MYVSCIIHKLDAHPAGRYIFASHSCNLSEFTLPVFILRSYTKISQFKMSSHNPSPPITLFHYHFSPWAQKITAYLALRGIPYTSCIQPVTLPRPDLTDLLNLKYRRIPILAIGRDVYCDTLLILEKLESVYPYSNGEVVRHGKTGTDRALEKLLEKWTDVVVFKYAANAIPTSFEAITDKTFQKDRQELWGRSWSQDHQDSLRPEALANLRSQITFLEKDVLEDGREWVLGGKDATLADIHAGWIMVWLRDMVSALPDDLFPRNEYPKAHAWFDRYSKARDEAMKKMETEGLVKEMSGEEVVKRMVEGPFGEKDLGVDERDPQKLKKGDMVQSYPTDTGSAHKDVGKLVGLSLQETVLEVKGKNDLEIRVHHPRWQFMVEKTKGNRIDGHKTGEEAHMISEGGYMGGRD